MTRLTRPDAPALATIQHRQAELRGFEPPEPPLQSDPTQPRPSLPPLPGLQLREAAFYGPAGHAVRTLAPHTEAHPAALLLQLLAAFGNALGPGPHCLVDATRHGLNLFVVLVGESSKARKGTSWNQLALLFSEVDHPWLQSRVTNARLTAGGLVYALRDQQPPTDRRLLALAEEFAAVLHTVGRQSIASSPQPAGHVPNALISPVPLKLPLTEGQDIRFKKLTGSEGLSQTRVSSVVQDNGIISRLGGSIQMRSSVRRGKRGTCFSIFLPKQVPNNI